jgi:hypothetical protein
VATIGGTRRRSSWVSEGHPTISHFDLVAIFRDRSPSQENRQAPVRRHRRPLLSAKVPS